MNKAMSYTGVLLGGFVAGALALKTLGDPSISLLPGGDRASRQAVLTALNTTPTRASRIPGDNVIADAAAKLEPSIVEIHTKGRAVSQAASPFGDDPIFRRFFGGQQGAPVQPAGAGSGVIISSDGYIMTNNHVINFDGTPAATVTVTVGDGDDQKEYTARVIGADTLSDIAVLKVNPTSPLRAAELGDSDEVRVGDGVLAAGNPLDVGLTVTHGIISAKDRKGSALAAEGQSLVGTRLQTDAAINPGNSGGALADINGRVIGINEAILSPTGSFIGIGLAIPINDAKKVAAQLIRSGKVTRPYIGISYGPLKAVDDLSVRRQYGLPLNDDDGAVVRNVYPGSPAAQAGVQTGDLILRVDGKTVSTVDTIQNEITAKSVGQTLTLDITRKGQPRTVTITLRERPATFGAAPQQPDQQPQAPEDQQPSNPFFP